MANYWMINAKYFHFDDYFLHILHFLTFREPPWLYQGGWKCMVTPEIGIGVGIGIAVEMGRPIFHIESILIPIATKKNVFKPL